MKSFGRIRRKTSFCSLIHCDSWSDYPSCSYKREVVYYTVPPSFSWEILTIGKATYVPAYSPSFLPRFSCSTTLLCSTQVCVDGLGSVNSPRPPTRSLWSQSLSPALASSLVQLKRNKIKSHKKVHLPLKFHSQ